MNLNEFEKVFQNINKGIEKQKERNVDTYCDAYKMQKPNADKVRKVYEEQGYIVEYLEWISNYKSLIIRWRPIKWYDYILHPIKTIKRRHKLIK